MGELIAPVDKGKVDQYTSDATKKTDNKGKGQLGKDAFLNLLVAQMRYQDPLSPSSDTEWIAQMASFSSLEQMQALNATISNSQAFSLIGQNVSVKENADSSKTVDGVVDAVIMKNGKAYVSINDEYYDASLIIRVVDGYYIAKQKAPTVEETKETYNHQEPKDINIKVNMGIGDGVAGSVYVVLDGKTIDSKHLAYDQKKGVLTIKKEALSGLDKGKYNVGFVFDDILKTVVSDKVTIQVEGVKPEPEPEPEEPDKEDPDKDKA